MQYTAESKKEFQKAISKIREEAKAEIDEVKSVYSEIIADEEVIEDDKIVAMQAQEDVIKKVHFTIPERIKEARDKILKPIDSSGMSRYMRVAHRFNRKDTTAGGLTLVYDFAVRALFIAYCSPGDSYCKKIGIDMALKTRNLKLIFLKNFRDVDKKRWPAVMRLLRTMELSSLWLLLDIQGNEFKVPKRLRTK